MHQVRPETQPDGTETVRLYGTTVDVTNKNSFTLFKKDYKVVRPKQSKKTGSKSSKAKKVDTEPVESE